MTLALIEGARVEFRREQVQYNEKGNAEKEADKALRLAEHDASWPPELVDYIWRWFCDLTDWRSQTMGVGPLSHLEMEAWARLMGIEISPFEVETLRVLDRECRSYHAEKDKEAENRPKTVGESLQRVADEIRAQKEHR